MLLQQLRHFSILGGKYDPNILFINLTPQTALLRKNLRRLRHYGPGGYSRSGCRGPEEYKKKGKHAFLG
jgi:hypothetical protein